MLTYYVSGIYNSVFHKKITFIQLILKQSMNSDCKPPLLSVMEQILECMMRLERGVGSGILFPSFPGLSFYLLIGKSGFSISKLPCHVLKSFSHSIFYHVLCFF